MAVAVRQLAFSRWIPGKYDLTAVICQLCQSKVLNANANARRILEESCSVAAALRQLTTLSRERRQDSPCWRRASRAPGGGARGGVALGARMPITNFTVEELKVATKHDAQLLGSGGFSKVFMGELGTGTHHYVAVKKCSDGGLQELQNEVAMLSRVDHVNVLPVLGSCWDAVSAVGMLVTPMMKFGSLHDALHHGHRGAGREGRAGMDASWRAAFAAGMDAAWRVTFVTGIAHGIRALHNEKVVHRDVKGANVLVSDDGVAVLADAGAAR